MDERKLKRIRSKIRFCNSIRQANRASFFELILMGITFPSLFLILFLTPKDTPAVSPNMALMLSIFIGFFVALSQVWRIDAFAKRHMESAYRLLTANGQNPLAIGTLIDNLNMEKSFSLTAPDFETHTRHTLIQLLPEIQAEDAAALKATHWQKLYKVLRGDDAYLIVATLKALKAAGNADALNPVRAITEGKSPAGQNEAIRALALECLPVLEERAAQAKNVRTLLRATNVPALPNNTLLRPASAASETPSEQLLRAASSD